jgi:DNA-binding PadR family transcriptional regulator
MKPLSRIEEILLLSILKLGDEAYGVSIREQILKDTGETWSFASIYPPLDILKQKGFVKKTKGRPSPERGGKCKYYYEVTQDGRQALREMHKKRQKIWTGVKDILWETRTRR